MAHPKSSDKICHLIIHQALESGVMGSVGHFDPLISRQSFANCKSLINPMIIEKAHLRIDILPQMCYNFCHRIAV